MNEFAKRRTWGPTPRYRLVEAYQPPSNDFIVVAGPCSVESVEHIQEMAGLVAAAGATHLRGGVFRAGTYPGQNFGWVNETLIAAFQKAAHDNGLQNIIEILDYTPEVLELILQYADCVQVGARSQQNYTLLRTLGATGKTVFLKRNPGSTLDELLGSAEHLLVGGNCCPVLIERGSSTHMNHVRWDLSISMIPAVRALTKMPVIVDAAHGTGRRDLVRPMALAGVAAGAGGVLIEVHNDPMNSLSDPDQAVEPHEFYDIMQTIKEIRKVL